MILDDEVRSLDRFQTRRSKYKMMIIEMSKPRATVVYVTINHYVTTHISCFPL
jgi:hypothetical protein